MYNNKKIGIGIITYNRQYYYSQLIKTLKLCDEIDIVVSIKNLNIDYKEDDPKIISNSINNNTSFQYIQVDEKISIAYNKNLALKELLKQNCDHIFIIEDDILIKNTNVFKEYIDTAKDFNLEHLNFCRAFNSKLQNFQVPYLKIVGKSKKLEIFRQLNGCFSYFSKNVIENVGFYNESYINVLEHCEHTYKISLLGFYTPFYAFADIENSNEFIEDKGINTSISHTNEYLSNYVSAGKYFLRTYGKKMTEIKLPTNEEVLTFLKNKIN